LVALSVHVRFICDAEVAVALRLVGAAGTVGFTAKAAGADIATAKITASIITTSCFTTSYSFRLAIL
jgi:hypothetical protein